MTTGRTNFSKADIGGEILSILTSGLYRDKLDAFREYIQNSMDAGSTKIGLSVNPDVVSIADDGKGMNARQARQAIRLGISEKNPINNVGFRGIGIYSGFNLCDRLEVFTRSKEDTGHRILFDFNTIRRELLSEQERRKRGQLPQLYLEALLEETVFVEPLGKDENLALGTVVVMSGLLPEAYRRINEWADVVEYLQNVVPLPFDPEFRYAEEIEKRFAEEDFQTIPVVLQIGNRQEEVYRPYTNSLFAHGGHYPPEFFEISHANRYYGFAWVCINDANATLKDTKVRGLLIKKKGFSIGDRRFVEPFFGRTVFSRRSTGEIIIDHDDLIPNAARSDFESNSTRQIFLREALPRVIKKIDAWGNNIQQNARAQEVLAETIKSLNAVDQELITIQRDRDALLRLNPRLSVIESTIKPHRRRLMNLDSDGLSRAIDSLNGAKNFVREALVVDRRQRLKLEKEIVDTVQRQVLAEEEQKEDFSGPDDLISLLDAYDLIDRPELRRLFQYLDENIIREHLDQDEYLRTIREIRDFLEEGP